MQQQPPQEDNNFGQESETAEADISQDANNNESTEMSNPMGNAASLFGGGSSAQEQDVAQDEGGNDEFGDFAGFGHQNPQNQQSAPNEAGAFGQEQEDNQSVHVI